MCAELESEAGVTGPGTACWASAGRDGNRGRKDGFEGDRKVADVRKHWVISAGSVVYTAQQHRDLGANAVPVLQVRKQGPVAPVATHPEVAVSVVLLPDRLSQVGGVKNACLLSGS